MMTPSELREYEFKGAGRNAYKSEDVDIFFGEVAVAYEKLFRENAEYAKRISLLADRLEQFKNDEDQIKQAVIGAQKAADIIVREAEMSVIDSKAEAEAILAAAKGEADIIKSDAEKQAIADSDLLLSIARDKAEEIINKAKEEARSILIEAKKSAEDTVGAANRTITSESIHFEMLKKEVSDFRASILAQYKAHIEMISKLPELAVEEAEKIENKTAEVNADVVDEIASVDPVNDIIEYLEPEEDATDIIDFSVAEEEEEGEMVVKTTLPFSFFEEETPLEFIEKEDSEDTEEVPDVIEFNENFTENTDTIEFVNDTTETVEDSSEDVGDAVEFSVESTEDGCDCETEKVDKAEDSEEAVETESTEAVQEFADILISKGFSINTDVSEFGTDDSGFVKSERPAMFDSFATIDDDDDDEDDSDNKEPKKKFGFFRRKKDN